MPYITSIERMGIEKAYNKGGKKGGSKACKKAFNEARCSCSPTS